MKTAPLRWKKTRGARPTPEPSSLGHARDVQRALRELESPNVPKWRAIAKKFRSLPLREIALLLKSRVHEDRSTALFILVSQYEANPRATYEFYMQMRGYVDSWDLVDASAYFIVGRYLYDHPSKRKVLMKLARSANMWDRRIAMVSMYHFIKNKRYDEPLQIAEALLGDDEDLIHKAVGWMLRELGKRGDMRVLNAFLDEHVAQMPRTSLRYAIERHSPRDRARYMRM